MIAERKKNPLRLLAAVLLAVALLTACTSKAAKAVEKVDLGQKYLTEQNYTEAVASFTEAIGLDPENIQAYMGRAEAYVALKQYDDAKADYTTAIKKTEDQPYTQAEAYIGRAEVNELTTDNEDALSDYESASTALDKVDVEKITDVTEQMLEALKIKVYNACARLSAFFGQNEAAAASYTKALDSLEKLPDDTDVLDVKAAKVESYTGRAKANNALEKYEEVLPDYDALIELGEDKSAERDTILAAMSLAKSKAGSLNSSDSWLDEVNHADYAEEIQLSAAEEVLKQAAEQAKADGTKAYDNVKKTLETEDAKAAMQNLLARGYQLRYYDADGKMLAVYVNDTAWADVNKAENGAITADTLKTVANPTVEDVSAVSLKNLYVYYGGYKGRSREGEGVWFILNPGKTDLTAETYTWKNDKPEGDFQKKEEPKAEEKTVDPLANALRVGQSVNLGGVTVKLVSATRNQFVWDTPEVLTVKFEIHNGSGKGIWHGNLITIQDAADLERIRAAYREKTEFRVTSGGKVLQNAQDANYAYTTPEMIANDDWGELGYDDLLPAGTDSDIFVYFELAGSNWENVVLTYTPSYAGGKSATFVVTPGDVRVY